jgi:hypothetical protein
MGQLPDRRRHGEEAHTAVLDAYAGELTDDATACA